MKMRWMIPCLLLLGGIHQSLQSQSVDPKVVSSSGNHHDNGSVKLSWTLGQLSVTTLSNTQNTLTQGFQQPYDLCTNVVNTNDSGEGSLRNAILCANKQPGPDTIRFFLPTNDRTIRLESFLPEITDDNLFINAEESGIGSVILDGGNIIVGESSFENAFTVTADFFELRGLQISNFTSGAGVFFNGVNDAVIVNNIFGNNQIGVQIRSGGSRITISSNQFICNLSAGISTAGETEHPVPAFEQRTVESILGTSSPGDKIELYLHLPDDCEVDVCQGRSLIDSTFADENGNWRFDAPYAITLNTGAYITATATTTQGQTSAFSECFFLCPVITQTNIDTICEGDVYIVSDATTAIEYSEPSGDAPYVDTLVGAFGCDSIVTTILTVIGPSYFPAIASEEVITCADNELVIGNAYPALNITGMWTSNLPTHQIDQTNEVSSAVSNLSLGQNEFYWTVSSSECIDYDADTVVIVKTLTPVAVDDENVGQKAQPIIDFDLVANDTYRSDFSFRIINSPAELTIVDPESDGVVDIIPDNTFSGTTSFTYEICNDSCGVCSMAEVELEFEKNASESSPPTYLCPVCPNPVPFEPVPCLPNCYDTPENSIVVVNRWGDVVYEQAPFQGQWFGDNNNGEPLPAGTYYYIIRLDISNSEILVGEIIILR
ncbi:MAG: gliding motility-associated C-terminal domain-containing protein [Bacteroidota bacterium]